VALPCTSMPNSSISSHMESTMIQLPFNRKAKLLGCAIEYHLQYGTPPVRTVGMISGRKSDMEFLDSDGKAASTHPTGKYYSRDGLPVSAAARRLVTPARRKRRNFTETPHPSASKHRTLFPSEESCRCRCAATQPIALSAALCRDAQQDS
jgi:hypothetical protein